MSNYSWRYGSRSGALQALFPPFTPIVKAMVVACCAVFAAQTLIGMTGGIALEGQLLQVFGLVPWQVLHHLRLWQPFTYLFLHGNLWHLAINMLTLWMFGSTLESDWGPRRFLTYYFITGVGAGLVSIAVAPWSAVATIGASGSIYGLLLAFAMVHPNRPILVYGIFPVKAKWFVLFLGTLAFASAYSTPGDGVAHVAHLGGMVFGYAYLKRVWRIGEFAREIRWRLKRRRFRVVRRGGNGDTRFPYH